jgi:hypothetical protein
VPAAANSIAESTRAELVLGHRDRFVNDECRASWPSKHVRHQVALQRPKITLRSRSSDSWRSQITTWGFT